jgi:hypothetical protein
MSRRQARKTTTAGSFGESRAQAEKSRLKGGCSQDWLPHKGSRPIAHCIDGRKNRLAESINCGEFPESTRAD